MHLRLTLREYEAKSFPAERLDGIAEQLYTNYNDYIDLEWPSFKTSGEWILKASGWVGYLPLKEQVVEIIPKVPIGNLFGMLETAYNLTGKSFKFLEGDVHMTSLADFYERLARVLAMRVLGRCRKGLYRTYRDENEKLPFVRGRIDMVKVTSRPWDPSLMCHYEDHTTDVEENAIILWTLSTILRSGYCTSRSLNQVRQAYRVLSRFVDLSPFSYTDCVGRLYNRLNDDYEPMHGLCRFFLEGTGPCQGYGKHRMIPFIINMPKLFENFVANWLSARLEKTRRYRLFIQKHKSVIGTLGSLNMHIDLVVQDLEEMEAYLVADTKYKAPDKLNKSDIYQVVTYAKAMNCTEAVLVYPTAPGEALDVLVGDIRVRSLVFDVSLDLDTAGEVFLCDLFA